MLLISQCHPLVRHREGVAFDCADRSASTGPLHRQFRALLRVSRLDLNRGILSRQENFTAARAIGIDEESSGLDRHGVPFMLHPAGHLVPIDAYQNV